jgi:hypothetical protein
MIYMVSVLKQIQVIILSLQGLCFIPVEANR